MNPQRRQFLIQGLQSILMIIFSIYIRPASPSMAQDEEQLVVCKGWIVKQKDLKPDACEPQPL